MDIFQWSMNAKSESKAVKTSYGAVREI